MNTGSWARRAACSCTWRRDLPFHTRTRHGGGRALWRATPVSIGASEPERQRRIERLLAEEGLDASYFAFVLAHLDRPDEQWRWCCGGNCDPCVQKLGRAVDRARTALAGDPPAPHGRFCG
jgi:hypothetical protein